VDARDEPEHDDAKAPVYNRAPEHVVMRIQVSHATTYTYDTPPSGVTQLLRLTPRDHEGQHVLSWRIDLSEDCLLHQHEDAFGNITHSFTAEGPFDKLSVEVNGEVDTQDTNGLVKGALERFPPELFLRETSLTQADSSIIDFAKATRADARGDNLALLHALLTALNREIAFDTDPTHAATTAAEAFRLRRGVCQDITHIFVAAARSLGIPARYVGGHIHRVDGVTSQEAGHAWAEAYVENLGWVGFDPTNGISTTDAHVRVAVGLDYLGAAPVRGTRYGGAGETLTVAVRVAQARQQIQN
jgi:transglutaminase-like putative cysteine protease